MPSRTSTGESRLTAAIPMSNPYCSCKLTRVWFALQTAWPDGSTGVVMIVVMIVVIPEGPFRNQIDASHLHYAWRIPTVIAGDHHASQPHECTSEDSQVHKWNL